MRFLTALHVLACVLLIIIILLQVGKGASTGASFGGGVRTVFGPTGAVSFLEKLIITLIIVLLLTTFSLGILSKGGKPPKLEPPKTAETTSVEQLVIGETPAVPG